MSTASSTRMVLLPDDSLLLELLARAEQLLELITTCEQDTASAPDQPTPWRLPHPLADGLATSALSRIASVIHAYLTPRGIPTQGPRLLAPERGYEHRPLRRVPVHVHDAETLTAAAQLCCQARAGLGHAHSQQRVRLDDLGELLAYIDDHPAVDPSVRAVPALAGLATLTAEPDPDLVQLAHLLAEAGQTDLVLTAETEQAYQRIADWMNTTLTGGGDPLERWAW